MSGFAVITLLLSITAFYVFLSIYILVYSISNHLGLQTVRSREHGEQSNQAHR